MVITSLISAHRTVPLEIRNIFAWNLIPTLLRALVEFMSEVHVDYVSLENFTFADNILLLGCFSQDDEAFDDIPNGKWRHECEGVCEARIAEPLG
jgi:hypothetical protein